ncbi:unnamed protein product [Diplocarpon coronariae]
MPQVIVDWFRRKFNKRVAVVYENGPPGLNPFPPAYHQKKHTIFKKVSSKFEKLPFWARKPDGAPGRQPHNHVKCKECKAIIDYDPKSFCGPHNRNQYTIEEVDGPCSHCCESTEKHFLPRDGRTTRVPTESRCIKNPCNCRPCSELRCEQCLSRESILGLCRERNSQLSYQGYFTETVPHLEYDMRWLRDNKLAPKSMTRIGQCNIWTTGDLMEAMRNDKASVLIEALKRIHTVHSKE